jgi:hypothetical protein
MQEYTVVIGLFSERLSTVAADPGLPTALRAAGIPNVLLSTFAGPSGRALCILVRLRRLAMKSVEKSGLIKFLSFALRAFAFVAARIMSAASSGSVAEPRSAATEFALLGGARFIDSEGASIQFLAIHGLDRGVQRGFRRQLDKSESARSPQFHIAHDFYALGFNIQALAKCLQIRFYNIKR